MINKTIEESLDDYHNIIKKFNKNNKETIPFCAAEPIISELVKSPLNSELAERYIKSGITNFEASKEFIGSEYIYPIYELISELCSELYNAEYADARPLSGMNAALTVLMSLTEENDNILLLGPNEGGHSSYVEITRRLSLNVTYIPYIHTKLIYNINQINKIIKEKKIKFIIIGPSNIISPPPIHLLDLNNETIVIYDATQSLGLIGTGHHRNPLNDIQNVVLIGGTHKTISGPTSGLILCKNKELTIKLETKISPIYIRNPHPHHIASLFLALLELKHFGKEFMDKILLNAHILGKALENEGFCVLKNLDNSFTKTHQLFIKLNEEERDTIEIMSRRLNISLDKQSSTLYDGSGIRLGVQAITRLGWTEKELQKFAKLLSQMKLNTDINKLSNIVNSLRGKKKVLFKM